VVSQARNRQVVSSYGSTGIQLVQTVVHTRMQSLERTLVQTLVQTLVYTPHLAPPLLPLGPAPRAEPKLHAHAPLGRLLPRAVFVLCLVHELALAILVPLRRPER
jgi:hypothetical protein